jgi:hypothetical protein
MQSLTGESRYDDTLFTGRTPNPAASLLLPAWNIIFSTEHCFLGNEPNRISVRNCMTAGAPDFVSSLVKTV